MGETVTLAKEDYQALLDRIQALEEKMSNEPEEPEKEEDEHAFKETADQFVKDSKKMVSGFLNASILAFNEAAHVFSDLAEDEDVENLDDLSAGMIGVFRKSIDIQKKVLDKFVEEYQKED